MNYRLFFCNFVQFLILGCNQSSLKVSKNKNLELLEKYNNSGFA